MDIENTPTVPEATVTTSLNIGKLAAALAIAQGSIEDAEKDSSNPHFRTKYASLAAVRKVAREPLSKNGLALMQFPTTGDKTVKITTMLVHAQSGEFIQSVLELPVGQWTPQGMGSAISYGRRYAFMAILSLAAEDDDGEHAQQAPVQQRHVAAQQQRQTAPAKQTPAEKRQPPEKTPASDTGHVTGPVYDAKDSRDATLDMLAKLQPIEALIKGGEFGAAKLALNDWAKAHSKDKAMLQTEDKALVESDFRAMMSKLRDAVHAAEEASETAGGGE
jgi:hypothetical protein